MTSVAAAWHPDPTGRHQLRWWNGESWTDHVSDAGTVGQDSLHGNGSPQRQPASEPVLWEASSRRMGALSDTHWVLTATALEIRSGRLTTSSSRVPLHCVVAVHLSRGMADKATNTGDITLDVRTESGEVAPVRMDNVPDPQAVVDVLNRLKQEAAERAAVAAASSELARIHRLIEAHQLTLDAYQHTVDLIDVGLYQRTHVLDDAAAYQTRLAELGRKQADMVKQRLAIAGPDGASAQTKAVAKLALRAYNGSVDALARKLRPYRLAESLARLDRERESIDRGLKPFGLHLSQRYHASKVLELELIADHIDAKEAEREELRAQREALREAEKVERQLRAERERLAKEREHYERALAAARATATAEELAVLAAKVEELAAAEASVEARAANTRVGHVYVISNIGSFGHGVVKIGMTRRLDPVERVTELGDASVPFRFDVHALVFSENAVELERRLHAHFADRRLNLANLRREFFYVAPQQVRDYLLEQRDVLPHGQVLEFSIDPTADEWHQSEAARARATQPAPASNHADHGPALSAVP